MIKVLIVEDDPMVREINSKFLNRVDGFKLVSAVANIDLAKAAVLDLKPQLILLDVFLPKENGIDLLKWLRQNAINCDVILITADKSAQRVQEGFRFGAVDYLIKPFSFERFKEALGAYSSRYDLMKSVELEQETLDKMRHSINIGSNESEGLTKGFNKLTYKLISDAILQYEADYFTADAIAEVTQVARVTVRKYLDYMAKDGALELLVVYGKVGRPQHKYKRIENR